MNDVRTLCKLWCLWNLRLLRAEDVLRIIDKDGLFQAILQSEWMKVSSTTDEEWRALEVEAETIWRNLNLRPTKKGDEG